jgi:hypothetical protein
MAAGPDVYGNGGQPDPALESMEDAMTVVQSYAAYFGYSHRVLEGAQRILDTLPKRTLVDRTEYAILEPGQAVGVVDTNEGGLGLEQGYRQRLTRLMTRLQPARRHLVINIDGTMEAVTTIDDTDENRRRLIEEDGIGIVPLIFEPTHILGRPDLKSDRQLFPYDNTVPA